MSVHSPVHPAVFTAAMFCYRAFSLGGSSLYRCSVSGHDYFVHTIAGYHLLDSRCVQA